MTMRNEDLVLKFQSSNDPEERRELIAELYQQNEGLIGTIVKHYEPYEDADDLKQQAFFGILEAAERWDPERGALFSSYAPYWIRQAVRRYLDNCGRPLRISSWMLDKVFQYQRLCTEYETAHNRKPTPAELIYFLDLQPGQLDEIRKAEQKLRMVSTSAVIGEDLTLEDTIADPVDRIEEAENELQAEELRETIWSVVNELPDREGQVVRMRYQDEKSLQQCGEILGVHLSRVRQIEARAFRKLRSPAVSKRLRPFLEDAAESFAFSAPGMGAFRRTGSSAVERAILSNERHEEDLEYEYATN